MNRKGEKESVGRCKPKLGQVHMHTEKFASE